MKKSIIPLAFALGLCVPAGAQIQALKGLASMAIPNSGLEEIRGEVVALTADVTKDVETLTAVNAGFPFLSDSIDVMKRRASAAGITLDVQMGTLPQLSADGYTMTVFDEEKYNKLGKVKKMAYLSKVHKALRGEHERYSALIREAGGKTKEVLDFFGQTDRQIRSAELKRGGARGTVPALDAGKRVAIEQMKNKFMAYDSRILVP